MKVLMLGWELPPHNSGGLGVACLELAKALANTGADIDFVLPYSTEGKYDFMNVHHAKPSKEEAQKLKVAQMSTRPSFGAYQSYKYQETPKQMADFHDNSFNHLTAYELGVNRLIKYLKFDVIHAHDWLTFRAALRVKQSTQKPLIVHIHSIERDRAGGKPGNPMVREIEYMTMLLADRVIAVSKRVKNSIVEDYSIPADKIEVVHNSIDRSLIQPLDTENEYRYLTELKKHGWKVVVNVGRLTVQKGLYHFLRTAQEVLKVQPKTIFLLVGDGEQRDELIDLSAEFGIADKVIFTGFQRGKKWRDAYAVGDIFVMPSISEPFGLTPLEAIGYGTPVLISKQSGVSEVLSNCLKADYWDAEKMANQITGVLRHETLASELHKNAWLEYERMSWSDSADKMMNIYKQHRQEVVAA